MNEFAAAAISLLITLAGFSIVLTAVYNSNSVIESLNTVCGTALPVTISNDYIYAYYQGCMLRLKTPVEVFSNGSWVESNVLTGGSLFRVAYHNGRVVLDTDRGLLTVGF
ncbi:hypothetical protein ACSU1N_02080 [Thermogladius sp. 4427co]|uniref:hypothetical protein n=1 Tax=Thermogladius sp. 4427co TaxID=3450718 RepID=UPI003F7A003E